MIENLITKGADSEYAFNPSDARTHVQIMTSDMALAHANFRLGQFLLGAGNTDEADTYLQQATELHPDSWNMWRQRIEPADTGLASGPEFWARVQALGDKRYYPMPDIAGMPE